MKEIRRIEIHTPTPEDVREVVSIIEGKLIEKGLKLPWMNSTREHLSSLEIEDVIDHVKYLILDIPNEIIMISDLPEDKRDTYTANSKEDFIREIDRILTEREQSRGSFAKKYEITVKVDLNLDSPVTMFNQLELLNLIMNKIDNIELAGVSNSAACPNINKSQVRVTWWKGADYERN